MQPDGRSFLLARYRSLLERDGVTPKLDRRSGFRSMKLALLPTFILGRPSSFSSSIELTFLSTPKLGRRSSLASSTELLLLV